GVSMRSAGAAVTGYWIALTCGRVLAACALRNVRVATLLRASFAALVLGLALFALRIAPQTDVAALLLAGAAAGPIFPSLIATTKERVGGAHTSNAIGFQIAAAALGQALVPALLGALGRRFGLDALSAGLAAIALAVTLGFARSQRSAHCEVARRETC